MKRTIVQLIRDREQVHKTLTRAEERLAAAEGRAEKEFPPLPPDLKTMIDRSKYFGNVAFSGPKDRNYFEMRLNQIEPRLTDQRWAALCEWFKRRGKVSPTICRKHKVPQLKKEERAADRRYWALYDAIVNFPVTTLTELRVKIEFEFGDKELTLIRSGKATPEDIENKVHANPNGSTVAKWLLDLDRLIGDKRVTAT